MVSQTRKSRYNHEVPFMRAPPLAVPLSGEYLHRLRASVLRALQLRPPLRNDGRVDNPQAARQRAMEIIVMRTLAQSMSALYSD